MATSTSESLTIADVLSACADGIAIGYNMSVPIRQVRIDSREVGYGDLFVALPGERVDGHSFVRAAIERGAAAALIEHDVDAPPGAVLIRVPNTLRALHQIAGHWRRRFKSLRVIGVTGSIGKTTTKELISQVLGRRFRVLKTEGNQNNEVGLPLAVLQLNRDHQRAVLEMGMYGPGEIADLAQVSLPAVGVVTKIEAVHMERLGTIEGIVKAKAELLQALPENGVAVLNDDDDRVRAMRAYARCRVVTCGTTSRADVWADDIESFGLDGIALTLHHRGDRWRVRVPLLGSHSAHTVLRAATVAMVEGMSWDEIVDALHEPSTQLRLMVLEGPFDSIVLDDTYNASAESTLAALNLLETISDGPRVAVLGDMLELGDAEEREHRLVGCRAAAVVAHLVCLGPRARWIAEEAVACGADPATVYQVATHDEALDRLRRLVTRKSVVLFKGSRGMAMEGLVARFVVKGVA